MECRKLMTGQLWAQAWCSTYRSWLLPWSLVQKLRCGGRFRRLLRPDGFSSDQRTPCFYDTHSFSFNSFWSCLGNAYFVQSYDCLLLTGLEHMTVPLSYIIPRVCLWIFFFFFGIVSVKHLVKVLFFVCLFLKGILTCFQFNYPLLNNVCRNKEKPNKD